MPLQPHNSVLNGEIISAAAKYSSNSKLNLSSN